MKRSLGLAAAVALHVLLLTLVMRHSSIALPAGAPVKRTDLVWAKLAPPPRPAPPAARSPQPKAVAPIIPRPAPDNPAADIPAPPSSIPPAEEENPAPVKTGDLVRMAGEIGKDLTSGQKIQISPDSLQRKMERGMAAARDGVKPKWYEGARMELFSAPNDPRKIYKITTAFGEYCVFYPDKTKDASGGAAYGQPFVSSCPVRF